MDWSLSRATVSDRERIGVTFMKSPGDDAYQRRNAINVALHNGFMI
jgi:hypothetical protein